MYMFKLYDIMEMYNNMIGKCICVHIHYYRTQHTERCNFI